MPSPAQINNSQSQIAQSASANIQSIQIPPPLPETSSTQDVSSETVFNPDPTIPVPSVLQKKTPSSTAPSKDILTILETQGKLTKEQAQEIREQNLHTGKDFEDLIEEKQLLSAEDIIRAKAELLEIPYISAKDIVISPQAIAMIPRSIASKFTVLPFNFDPKTNELSVAMADPNDLQILGFLEQRTNAIIKPFSALKEELVPLINDRYGATLSTEVKQIIKESELGRATSVASKETGQVIQQAPIAKIINYILDYAINTRSSDVHIEPQEDKTRIRYRIDGILYEKLVLPRQVHENLASKIKIMGEMKIDERRLPQDGRFNYQSNTEEIDLRVSSLPTVHGEKIVLRLLKKTGGAKTLQELGLRGRALKNFEEAITRPHGIILVCGPTGSGKTTTLYSVISKINTSKVNILTLEDPVEYRMPGVNQVQINPQAGLTFASGLRSFLRQDPNIIMVGEIRDSETTALAIQSALTGHLVFSTLHTNDAAGALPRLLDLEAEPFLLSSIINAVVAQRVVRLICNHCKTGYLPTQEVIEDIKSILGNLFPQQKEIKLYKGEGCSECGTTGYKGRIGIFEVLTMSEAISKMIMERTPASKIGSQAIQEGMITLKQDGILKVLEGITTIEEVLRVAED